jgi:hypothetical protein
VLVSSSYAVASSASVAQQWPSVGRDVPPTSAQRRKKSDCLLFQIDGGGQIGLNAHVRDAAPDSPGKSMPGLCLAITRKAMAHDRNAYPEERPFDWARMNRFWEEALSRLKAYVEAEESHDVRPSDAARDRYGTPSD